MNNDPTHLIIRFLSNEATPEEHETLFEWINEDPRHHKMFEEYYFLWHKKAEGPAPLHLQKRLQHLNARIDALEAAEEKAEFFNWAKLAVAALLIISVSTGIWIAYYWRAHKPNEVEWISKTGSFDRRTSIKLADGSEIQLNASSTLRYPKTFTGEKREVYLTGEGFFSIAKDASHPFVVHTSSMTTEVLGTSFNIREDQTISTVTVATGKVKVEGNAQSRILTPYQKVVYDRGTGAMEVVPTALAELGWRENTIVFEDTNLLAASKTLEDWFGVSIHFENQKIQQCRITGKFRNESLAHILEAIAFSTGIKFKINNKTVHLSGNGC